MNTLELFLTNSQVRGTPGSGKTSLAELLCQHIRQQEPATKTIWIQGWSPGKGGWLRYFETQGWVQGAYTVFIFDEAQFTYVDGELWNRFFKSISKYPNVRAIIFTSFGSPSSRITIAGTSMQLTDRQRVTLRAVQHDDKLPPVGLLFTGPS